MREIGVYPRDELVRQHLKHPSGVSFARYPDATPWPRDGFTARRLREGALLTEMPGKPVAKPVEEIASNPPAPRFRRRPTEGV